MKNILQFLLCIFIIIGISITSLHAEPSTPPPPPPPPPSQYLATVHHSSPEYTLSKRGMKEGRFVGNLKYNNTVNENGEVTISLCDITHDLFGQIPSFTLFDYDKSAGVNNLASAELKAKLQANVQIDGCLVFFFNPCCKTFGLKVVLDDPVVLSATGSLHVDVEAFSFGVSAGSNNINLSPLNNIDISGFSPVIGAWNLPPILDQFVTITDRKLCAKLGLPGTTVGLDFCVVLNNFTAGVYGVNVCPRLTISFGKATLFDVSYAALTPGATECLTLSFFPTCSYNGSPVSPDILQLFKSADADNDHIMTIHEMMRASALLGSDIGSSSSSFHKMDDDHDGQVNFSEFQRYASAQADSYDKSPKTSSNHRTFSGGDIAAAVLVTLVGTLLIGGAVLLGVAQYKGIFDIRKFRK